MPYTAKYSPYRDVAPALDDCICHILPYTAHSGMWRCSGGKYMPYTAIYSTYRDVVPPLGDCICHILPYTAHTGTWGLLRGTLYTIHCHIQHIQGCGACSGGLYMPYTAIYSTYRDVGPALEDCICHTLPYTAHTGMWGLLWGNVYPIHCHIQHIQGCGACSGGMYMPYTVIHCHIQHIQGYGASSRGLYMP